MVKERLTTAAAVATLLLGAAACSEDGPTAPTAPTTLDEGLLAEREATNGLGTGIDEANRTTSDGLVDLESDGQDDSSTGGVTLGEDGDGRRNATSTMQPLPPKRLRLTWTTNGDTANFVATWQNRTVTPLHRTRFRWLINGTPVQAWDVLGSGFTLTTPFERSDTSANVFVPEGSWTSRVQARNRHGRGPTAVLRGFNPGTAPAASAPGAPRTVTARASGNRIDVEWDHRSTGGAPVRRYLYWIAKAGEFCRTLTERSKRPLLITDQERYRRGSDSYTGDLYWGGALPAGAKVGVSAVNRVGEGSCRFADITE